MGKTERDLRRWWMLCVKKCGKSSFKKIYLRDLWEITIKKYEVKYFAGWVVWQVRFKRKKISLDALVLTQISRTDVLSLTCSMEC